MLRYLLLPLPPSPGRLSDIHPPVPIHVPFPGLLHPTSQPGLQLLQRGGRFSSSCHLNHSPAAIQTLTSNLDHPGYSYYASATSLSPRFYQTLVDRCWRRSGTLLYRPNQKDSCCPHYTIRLDAHRFKPAKDQRQAVNRFNTYVTGEPYAKEATRLRPLSRQDARKRANEFDLVQRVHEAETQQLRTPPEPAHRFDVTLEPDTFTEEKYAVFENYQRLVHHEPPHKISRGGFKRFLCNSPLKREDFVDTDGKERQLGSFHHCYRLDGKLVAIGVLDLLPHCVSAVYFIYHESIHMHTPGKLGALREIALAAELGYRWWYAGFYIHSCPKMRYKIDYSPQYVLDPETLAWDLLDKEALAIFDRQPYVSLSSERRGLGLGGTEDTRTEHDTIMENGINDGDESGGEENAESLLSSNMPGIPSFEQMLDVNMDGLHFVSDYSMGISRVSDLAVWNTEEVGGFGSLKSAIAELVAAVGPDLIGEICLDFRRRTRPSS